MHNPLYPWIVICTYNTVEIEYLPIILENELKKNNQKRKYATELNLSSPVKENELKNKVNK